ncbi:MAG: CotH kinase family protein [Bacteroidota bacterium]
MKNSNYFLFFVILLMVGCAKEEASMPTTAVEEPSPTNTTPSNPATGNEQYVTEKSSYIFDQKKLPTFELNLPEEQLAKIDADPAAEAYVEGSLTFEGETISPVGIRYKGSIGAFVGCLSGNNWANPSGRKTCTKLSMKIKINWDDPEARFYGLRKLQFHSQNMDKSQMRDRLGYWFFRKMDVAAPRAIHAKLLINGQYIGLFSLVEQIDGRFTRHHFEDGTGNLYKEIWPLKSNGQPHSEQAYLEKLKTNEDENPSVEMIRHFAQAVANASEGERRSIVEKWMNLDAIISYAVVDRTIRNDDGAFHWYCNGPECSPHNFYWYEEPTTQKLHLVPWDLDNAFENIKGNVNPVTPIGDSWGEISNNCEPFSVGFFGPKQRSAACDKLVATWASYVEEYAAKKQAFLEGYFSEERVNEKLTEWSAQIREATEAASQAHEDAITVAEWERALETLKQQLQFARVN